MQSNILQPLKEHQSSLNTSWAALMIEKGFTDGMTEEEESKEFTRLFLEAAEQGAASQNLHAAEFDKLYDLLSGISVSRAKRGFSPRETAQYVLSFKQAASKLLS